MVFTLWNDAALSAPANQVGPTLTFDGAAGNPPAVSVLDPPKLAMALRRNGELHPAVPNKDLTCPRQKKSALS